MAGFVGIRTILIRKAKALIQAAFEARERTEKKGKKKSPGDAAEAQPRNPLQSSAAARVAAIDDAE